ncbi:ferritin-like domain-containing protein [Paraburkholderia solisilvae]|uniref:Iminophenyl-pyruvate dimer synthase domain-containing protein n=1 Tax=Paraburkholderia solisilvae TaxID=624376 RepID=A0A6J5DQ27_9BURK|nr:ferritin-like protein [Paraburkholderia solisilvae]CAB3755677.1 hypothetical protein LMG29739_02243 [Paraburkholderia solisilvae]
MTLQDEKEALYPLLQTALELELSTIPPYLIALLSIRRDANRGSAELIRSVMMEEMLHMVLVGNLMSSIGGRVRLGSGQVPRFPVRLAFQGKAFRFREFDVDLRRFSPEALQTFLQIEIPDALVSRGRSPAAAPDLDISGLTIGEFYTMLGERLRKLCEAYGEPHVFCGDSRKQVGEQYYWAGSGKPVVVSNLASALEALETIVSQGEGCHGSIDDDDAIDFNQPTEFAHYFRFNEIRCGRHYRVGDSAFDPPGGEPLRVDYEAVYPIKTNPKHSDYAPGSKLAELNEHFNQQYSLLLTQIETALNGVPSVLYDAITGGMHRLTPIAIEMMSLPVDDRADSPHGAPSFEWAEPPSDLARSGGPSAGRLPG